MASSGLKGNHPLRQIFGGHLQSMAQLTDGKILAIDTSQIATSEKDGA
jgi:hypothetical protein